MFPPFCRQKLCVPSQIPGAPPPPVVINDTSLRNGKSPYNQYGICEIYNPGDGNKTLEQNDNCTVMLFILWQKLLFSPLRIA